jgi:phenylalanyl-tRNA synthetase beta chain
MNFTFNWLKEFVPFAAAPEKLGELLTMAGLEVEALAPLTEPETGRDDWLFTVGVTPNRGDCLGIRGIAREVAAITGQSLEPARSRAAAPATVNATGVEVSIEEPRLCPRYSACLLHDLATRPSPPWLRFRLEACGIRAINNVVDITNYVMLETGQPLHAFDFDLLPAPRIVVRTAGAPTKFTTLDGSERDLAADDLLICSGTSPIALAGVMGGINSEVHQGTRSVLLESAHFDPTAVRRTAKRLGLHSEASHRFERGVDPNGTLTALERASELLAELAGASPAPEVVDRYPRPPKLPEISLRDERTARLLGTAVALASVEQYLRSLGVATRRAPGARLVCVPPSSRPDLTREADLIEEIARLYGYDRLPAKLPPLRPGAGARDELLQRQRAVRAYLAGDGFLEAINLPFTSDHLNRTFMGLWQPPVMAVTLLNPLVKESAEMRVSLIPGLLENLRTNLAHRAGSVWLYHLGKVFRAGASGPEEGLYLSAVLYGARPRRGLRQANERPPGFLDCKGIVEGIFELLRLGARVTWTEGRLAPLHPGRQALALLDGRALGYAGEIHPDICDRLDLPAVLIFELDLEKSLEYAPRRISVRNLPRFPAVERDFALVVERDFQSQRIIDWINIQGEPLIEHVDVFDEYRGTPIPQDKKSLAYKISFRAEDRTLTDAEVSSLHQSLIEEITKVFGAELRS